METRYHHGSPGVYLETKFERARWREFRTGVPVFIGFVGEPRGAGTLPVLTAWEHLNAYFQPSHPDSYLPYAVRGFFENGGEQCYVIRLTAPGMAALQAALRASEALNTIDLVCAPDLFSPLARESTDADYDSYFRSYTEQQQAIVQHCAEAGGRFAVLDTDCSARWESAWNLAKKNWSEIDGPDGAIYLPWIKVRTIGTRTSQLSYKLVPPCGHIAGVYARSDRQRGVHKAPANEILRGVLDLEYPVSQTMQAFLNPKSINCLRAFPGRGIRVWGARTLASDESWRFINVRRVFTTAIRWLQCQMWEVAFEPNDQALWARIERELSSYFAAQYRRGALGGTSPQSAFYVKCDASTNPVEFRDLGIVVTEIGLVLTPQPFEFVVVRLIHGAAGVSISGPVGSWQPSEGE